MKTIQKIGLTLFLFFIANLSFGQYQLKSHKIELKGTAKPDHAWTSKATKATVKADFVIENNTFKALKSASLEIQTKGIKSDKKSDLMDERTYETLLADKHPTINYAFSQLKSNTVQGDETSLTLAGTLTIAGKSQNIDLLMKGKLLKDGSIELNGSHKLKMSNYGIKPPSFMFGALKVMDDVTIVFQLTLQK